jgi:hypothetical protein
LFKGLPEMVLVKGPLGIKIAHPPVSDDPVLTMRKAPAEEQDLALAKQVCNLCPCNDLNPKFKLARISSSFVAVLLRHTNRCSKCKAIVH